MLLDTEYYHLPPREIEQAISWLEHVQQDCEFKISRLRQIQSQNERQKRHMRNMNALAAQFDEPEFFDHTPLHQVEVIRQRLGCEYHRAHHIRDLLLKRKAKRDRKTRNAEIIELYRQKKKVTHIADKVGVSRPTVYAVIEEFQAKSLL